MFAQLEIAKLCSYGVIICLLTESLSLLALCESCDSNKDNAMKMSNAALKESILNIEKLNASKMSRDSKVTSVTCDASSYSLPSNSYAYYCYSTYTSYYAYGDYCYIYCNSGYMWSDASSYKKFICYGSNTWTTTSATCSTACSTLQSTPSNAYTSCSSSYTYSNSYSCSYYCNAGYHWKDGSGSQTSTCTGSNTWSSISSTCVSSAVGTKPAAIIGFIMLLLALISKANF